MAFLSLARALGGTGRAGAGAGRRREARTWLRPALRTQPLNLRAWLGLAVSLRLISPAWVARLANLAGKGV